MVEGWSERELERSRAVLVRKYRMNPRAWPDGIDTKTCRWFTGHEGEWTELRIARALGEAKPVDAVVSTEASTASTGVDATKSPKQRKAERQARWRAMKKARGGK